MITTLGEWDPDSLRIWEDPITAAIRDLVARNSGHTYACLSEGPALRFFKSEGILFCNLPSGSLARSLLTFLLKFVLGVALRPSVIVCMGTTHTVPFGISTILTRARFIPVVVAEITHAIREKPRVLKCALAVLQLAVLDKAYAVLAVSESIKQELTSRYAVSPTKVHVYKYRIFSGFHPAPRRHANSAADSPGKTVLAVCRINREKGLEYFLEASRLVREELGATRFVVIAASCDDKQYYEKLRNMVVEYGLGDSYSFLTGVPYSQMPVHMASADVFVLPSVTEGRSSEAMPIAVLEAMASGVAVVATRVGGVPDVVVHEYNGLLVDPCDVRGLANAIIRVLDDEKLRARLGEVASKTVKDIGHNEFGQVLSRMIFAPGRSEHLDLK